MNKMTFRNLSLIWKILFFLVLFQAIVLIGYAYLAKAELDERLIEEKVNFKEMSEVYLTKSISNHVQNILDEIYATAEQKNNTQSEIIHHIKSKWPDIAINWGATGVGIFDKSQTLTFEYGEVNLTSIQDYIDNSYQSNMPSKYIVCQQTCTLNILTPLYLDQSAQVLLVSTNLFNPIFQFQELLDLKSAIVTALEFNDSSSNSNLLNKNWLDTSYEMSRKETNKYYYELLKKANMQSSLYKLITTGEIVNLQDSYYFISAFQLPFEHNQNGYFLVFNDISSTLKLDKSFNQTYILFSILALAIMTFLVMVVLFPPIARIKKLRAYLPTLAQGQEIKFLPLAERQIIFRDEIDILEDSSNELAMHLTNLNNAANEREIELKELALFDHLTSLPNRVNFTNNLTKAISKIGNTDKFMAVIFIDLDRFKQINDTLGHDVGDEVLKTVAKRLKNSIRASDIVARLGGDEFTILLKNLSSNENILKIIDVILNNFKNPAHINNRMINIQLSMGISIIKDKNTAMTEVIKHADIAMYDAKANKDIRYSFFRNEMESKIINEFNLLNDFNSAINNNEFQLLFQPFYNLKDDSLFGFECLVRWQHSEKGLLTPDKFLPILQDTEHMQALEKWVLEEGIKHCKAMNKITSSSLVFSINLSADMFMSKELVVFIEELLNTYDVDPKSIYIEIVEDSLISDLNAGIARIEELQQIGIKVSLDDFGVGYSSLSYLRQLPVDNIKIDRSFVQEILHHKNSKKLLASLIDLLINIDKTVTAEGIENVRQLEWLKLHGCHIGQGYLFDKPLKNINACALIRADSKNKVSYFNLAKKNTT